MVKTILPPTTVAHEAFRVDFDGWLGQHAGATLVRWTSLRAYVQTRGNFSFKDALAFMKSRGLELKGIKNAETHQKNDDYVHRGGQPLRMEIDLEPVPHPHVVPAGPAAPIDLAPTDTRNRLLFFAAAFGMDSRLGIMCFDKTEAGLSLHIGRLRAAVNAVDKNMLPEFQTVAPANYSGFVQLYDADVQQMHMEGGPFQQAAKMHTELASRPFEVLKDVFARVQQQVSEVPTLPLWGKTLRADEPYVQNKLLDVLSIIANVKLGPTLIYHIKLGFQPTCQRLRTEEEYSQDFFQVGTAVEELEFTTNCYVPRPPAL